MCTCWNMYIYDDKWHRLKGNESTFRKDDQHWTKRRHIAKKNYYDSSLMCSIRREKSILFRVKILLEAMHNNDKYRMNQNVECSALFLFFPFLATLIFVVVVVVISFVVFLIDKSILIRWLLSLPCNVRSCLCAFFFLDKNIL